MTVKYIYSPLKQLYHRDYEYCPPGIADYAFYVFQHTHTHVPQSEHAASKSG